MLIYTRPAALSAALASALGKTISSTLPLMFREALTKPALTATLTASSSESPGALRPTAKISDFATSILVICASATYSPIITLLMEL